MPRIRSNGPSGRGRTPGTGGGIRRDGGRRGTPPPDVGDTLDTAPPAAQANVGVADRNVAGPDTGSRRMGGGGRGMGGGGRSRGGGGGTVTPPDGGGGGGGPGGGRHGAGGGSPGRRKGSPPAAPPQRRPKFVKPGS